MSTPHLRHQENPPNPFHSAHVEWLDQPPPLSTSVYEEQCRSILSRNDSPDLRFTWSINPYRGCFHGCAYCYARPSHQYLDLGAGTDFERKIIVKINAAEVLRRSLSRTTWKQETILFSGNTDCYQPFEASYELTRRCLEVCADMKNPVSIITKGALIRRDIDVLQRLLKQSAVHVHLSIAFNDDDISRMIEPGAPRPSLRFRVMKELHDAGIPVSISLAPMIPGLNDTDIPHLLKRAKEAGARSAFMTPIRLPGPVRDIFLQRIQENFPGRFQKIEHAIRDIRGGVLNDPRFGARMIGNGARWDAVSWLFLSTCQKLGIATR